MSRCNIVQCLMLLCFGLVHGRPHREALTQSNGSRRYALAELSALQIVCGLKVKFFRDRRKPFSNQTIEMILHPFTFWLGLRSRLLTRSSCIFKTHSQKWEGRLSPFVMCQMKSVRGILRIQYHNSRDLNFSISHPWCACSISRGLFNYFALEFLLFSEPPHEILQGHSKPAKSEESLFVHFLLGKIL